MEGERPAGEIPAVVNQEQTPPQPEAYRSTPEPVKQVDANTIPEKTRLDEVPTVNDDHPIQTPDRISVPRITAADLRPSSLDGLAELANQVDQIMAGNEKELTES